MNDNYYAGWTDEDLLKEYEMLDDMIHGKNACYGVKDIKLLIEASRELSSREDQRSSTR